MQGLLPLCLCELASPMSRMVGCSDASLDGGGGCVADIPTEEVLELSRFRVHWRFKGDRALINPRTQALAADPPGLLPSPSSGLQVFERFRSSVAVFWMQTGAPSSRTPGLSLNTSPRLKLVLHSNACVAPSPPTKSFPTKGPRVELSGRLPIKFNGHENFHPLELRVCLSQTLRNPNS